MHKYRFRLSSLSGPIRNGTVYANQHSKAAWKAALLKFDHCFVERQTGIVSNDGKFGIYQFRNGRRHYLGNIDLAICDH